MKRILIGLSIAFFIFCFWVEVGAATWYVDNAATGANNGTSWANSWTSFSKIVWGPTGVKAGDTIYISGGAISKTYTQKLNVGASGSEGNPIIIRIGQDSGHNGMVIIDINYQQSEGWCLRLNNRSYITINGQVGDDPTPRIRLTKGYYSGLDFSGTSSYFDVSFLDIVGNGNMNNSHGITSELQASNNWGEIHHCTIHDNYEDQLHLIMSPLLEATQYGSLKIHHNDIYDLHDDGIEMSLGGVDIYNNTIHSRGVYRTGHADGIQCYNSFYRFYNNYFYDIIREDDIAGNAAIFVDPFVSPILNPNHIQVFNNLVVETRVQPIGGYYRGLSIKFSESAITGASDILIANNTVVGTPFYGVMLTFGNFGSSNVSNVVIVNNLFKDACRSGVGSAVMAFNKGDGTITYGSYGSTANVIVDYNIVYASSEIFKTDIAYWETIDHYANFRQDSGCQDHDAGSPINPALKSNYTLQSDSPAKDRGVNLSSFFNTDKNGVYRPYGSGWDVGAFEYFDLAAPAPPKNVRLIE